MSCSESGESASSRSRAPSDDEDDAQYAPAAVHNWLPGTSPQQMMHQQQEMLRQQAQYPQMQLGHALAQQHGSMMAGGAMHAPGMMPGVPHATLPHPLMAHSGPANVAAAQQAADAAASAAQSKAPKIKVTMKGQLISGSSPAGGAAAAGEAQQLGQDEPAGEENGEAQGKKKKKPRHPPGQSKKSYPDMISESIYELKSAKGVSLQALKKHMVPKYRIASSRFAQQLSMALKKMVSSKALTKNGVRYKLDPKILARIRSEDQRKKKAAEEAEWKKRVKRGEVTAEEIAERKRLAEEEERRKEEKLERDRNRAAARRMAELEEEAMPAKRKSNMPRPALPRKDLPFLLVMGDLVAVAEFCSEYAEVLDLLPFSVEMLYNALACNRVTTLLREVHLVLLRLCLEPEMKQDERVVRWDWFRMLNSLTWQEILRRYLLRARFILGSDYEHAALLAQAAEHLQGHSYVSLPLEAKLAVLRVLVDDCASHPEVVEAIDVKVRLHSELATARWNEDMSERKESKRIREALKSLGRGKVPPKELLAEGELGASEGDEKTPISKRAIEALRESYDKQLERLHEERLERGRQLQRDMQANRVRAEPWGHDSRGNSFWSFQSDPTRLYVYGFGVRGEDVSPGRAWRYYDSVEEVEKLLASCDAHSRRERQLKREIEFFKDEITSKLAATIKKKAKPAEVKLEAPKPDATTKDKDKDGDAPMADAAAEKAKPAAAVKEEGHEDEGKEDDKEGDGEASDEPLVSRIRPRRGAAKAAEEMIRDQSASARRSRNGDDGDENGDGDLKAAKKTKRKKPLIRRKKTWDDADQDAFERYENLWNDVQGLELDLENPTQEQEDSSLDDPDVKLFKDAERVATTSRVLAKDMAELAEFLTDRGGRFGDGDEHQSAFVASVDSALRVPESIKTERVVAAARPLNAPELSASVINPRPPVKSGTAPLSKAPVESSALSEAQASSLREICTTLERVATDAVVHSKSVNAQKEAMRKARVRQEQEKRRQAAVASQRSAIEAEKRKADRRVNASSKRKRELAARNGKLRKKGKGSRASKRRRTAADDGPTTLSGRTSRINYSEKVLEDIKYESEEDEDDEDDLELDDDDDDEEEEEDEEEDEVVRERELAAAAAAAKFVINEDIDVPEDEAARIDLLQRFESLYLPGTPVRCEVDGPDGVKTAVNGVVGKTFFPASFLASDQVEDRWTIDLDGGRSERLNQEQVEVALQRRRRWELEQRQLLQDQPPAEVSNGDAGEVEAAVAAPGAAAVAAAADEDSKMSPEEAGRRKIQFLWGTKSEREAWLASAQMAKTCSAWSAVFYQLANRIYINNSLKK